MIEVSFHDDNLCREETYSVGLRSMRPVPSLRLHEPTDDLVSGRTSDSRISGILLLLVVESFLLLICEYVHVVWVVHGVWEVVHVHQLG